jgi:diacylglycerol kinase
MAESFSGRKRLKSFVFAFAGLRAVLRTEHNTWIHLAFTIVVALMALLLHVSSMEWVALVIVFAMVWMAEIFNTVFEKLADLYTTDHHPQIKVIKDMAAGAVLIAAMAAFLVGCFIFIPRIIALI